MDAFNTVFLKCLACSSKKHGRDWTGYVYELSLKVLNGKDVSCTALDFNYTMKKTHNIQLPLTTSLRIQH